MLVYQRVGQIWTPDCCPIYFAGLKLAGPRTKSMWFLDLLQAALPQETSALPDDFALDCMLVTQLIACS
jgi:hypothetical protein